MRPEEHRGIPDLNRASEIAERCIAGEAVSPEDDDFCRDVFLKTAPSVAHILRTIDEIIHVDSLSASWDKVVDAFHELKASNGDCCRPVVHEFQLGGETDVVKRSAGKEVLGLSTPAGLRSPDVRSPDEDFLPRIRKAAEGIRMALDKIEAENRTEPGVLGDPERMLEYLCEVWNGYSGIFEACCELQGYWRALEDGRHFAKWVSTP